MGIEVVLCVCVCVCARAQSTVSSCMHKDPKWLQDASFLKLLSINLQLMHLQLQMDAQKLFTPLCIEDSCFAPQKTFSHLDLLSFSPSLTHATTSKISRITHSLSPCLLEFPFCRLTFFVTFPPLDYPLHLCMDGRLSVVLQPSKSGNKDSRSKTKESSKSGIMCVHYISFMFQICFRRSYLLRS